MESYDAIVIGAGHNGLVAAVYLARAGWRTLVVERSARPGGAVQSDELTRPGLVHDVFATNMNLFRGSPVAAELGSELERHGLEYATSALPFANVFPDGAALRVHQDRAATIAGLRAHDPDDAAGWEALDADYERFAPALFALYGSRMTPRALARLAVEHGRDARRRRYRDARAAAGQLDARAGRRAPREPRGARAARLLGDAPRLRTRRLRRRDLPVPGGVHRHANRHRAGPRRRLPPRSTRSSASCARREASFASGPRPPASSSPGGRAVAVELAGGERVGAHRAVIAGVTPTRSTGGCSPRKRSRRRCARGAAGYAYGPGTMMVHLALSGPIPWRAGADLARFAYVHVAPYVDDLAATYAQATAGLLPTEPMLVVGQTSAVDDSRAPGGGQVVWVQVRALPGRDRRRRGGRDRRALLGGGRRAIRGPGAREARALRAGRRPARRGARRALARRARAPQPEPGRWRFAGRQHAPSPERAVPTVPGRARLRDRRARGC